MGEDSWSLFSFLVELEIFRAADDAGPPPTYERARDFGRSIFLDLERRIESRISRRFVLPPPLPGAVPLPTVGLWFFGSVMPIFQGQPELLEAFRRGERWALEHVYRAHVRMLDGYLRNLARASAARELGVASAVADSLQEVFIRAFSPAARSAYDGTRPYGPYLRKIAKNLFIDQLRAHGSGMEESVDTLPDTFEGAPVDGEPLVDPRVTHVLSSYLATLPPPLLGVYEQRFVLGNSQEIACSALGITRRKLRTDEERLKSGLRRALVSNGILRGDLSPGVTVVRSLGSHAL